MTLLSMAAKVLLLLASAQAGEYSTPPPAYPPPAAYPPPPAAYPPPATYPPPPAAYPPPPAAYPSPPPAAYPTPAPAPAYPAQSYAPGPAYGYYPPPPKMTPQVEYPLPSIVPRGPDNVEYDPNLCLMKLPAQVTGPYAGKCITVKHVNDGVAFALKKLGGLQLAGKPGPEVTGSIGDVVWTATVWLTDTLKIPPRVAAEILPWVDVSKTHIWKICPNYYKPDHIDCVMSKYPRMSGDCNDIKDEEKASSGRLLRRLLPNAYADGLGAQRQSVTGGPLPNARLVSNVVHYSVAKNEKFWNNMFLVFGQFMDHEILLSSNFPQNYNTPNGVFECCKYKGHHDCTPVRIPANDPFYSFHKKTCLNIYRVQPGLWNYCVLGAREPWNSATPIIDASQVYGPDYSQYAQIMDPNSYGKLRTYKPWKGQEYAHLKPMMHQKKRRPDVECHRAHKDMYCLFAGDIRATQQAALSVIHILFLRLHNDLVEKLRYINPHWGKDRLFEEARRIVIAYNQHISMNEWMPAMLDSYYLDLYKLRPAKLYRYDYDKEVDPQVSHEFAAAAFRFAHSLLPDTYYLASKSMKVYRKIPLRELIDRPEEIYVPGHVDKFILGSLVQPIHKMDAHVTTEVRNYLNKGFAKIGEDLPARNIMRGRDHGIRGYLEYRRLCNLKPEIYGWDDLRLIMPNKTVDGFKSLYKSVEDLELWSAGIAENNYKKGLVGETFACIIAEQYSRTIHSDRFWYENPGFPNSFTPAQLKEIKKISLSRIICDQSDDIEYVPRWSMQLQDYDNNKVLPCKSQAIPIPSLEPWREKGYGGPYMQYSTKYESKQEIYPQPQYPMSYNQYKA